MINKIIIAGKISAMCATSCFEFNVALVRAIKRGKHDLFNEHLQIINDYLTEYKIALVNHLFSLPFMEIDFDKYDEDCGSIASTIEHYFNDDYYNFVTILYVHFTKMYKLRNELIKNGYDKSICNSFLEKTVGLLCMDNKYVRRIS